MISRRGFISMLTGAALASPFLVPNRTYFLPPASGWARLPLASLYIPRSAAMDWADAIKAGTHGYDDATETMHLYKAPRADIVIRDRAWSDEPWGLTGEKMECWFFDENCDQKKQQISTERLVYLGNIQEREAAPILAVTRPHDLWQLARARYGRL